MTWDIEGRTVLVTGGNSGIGRMTVEALAGRGAHVTFTSRDRDEGVRVAADIGEKTGADVEVGVLDLSRLDSVRSFAAEFLDAHDRLDVLVNNAGVMVGSRRETPDGFEWTFGVNHLGPFLLTNLLVPTLIGSAPARILTVSSRNHVAAPGIDFDDLQMTHGYTSSKAYARSKLANVLFTVELERRLGDRGVTSRALHPGVVATRFGRDPESPWLLKLLMPLAKPVLRSPERGAATSVMLATADDPVLEQSLYWSEEEPADASAAATDAQAARRLWEVSAELVGLPGDRA